MSGSAPERVVSVVIKQPPGGRCTLYLRYADAIAELVGGRSRLLYPVPEFPLPERPLPPPPALLVGERHVAPADGVILSPQEVCDAVRAAGWTDDAAALLRQLESEEERMMEEWANAAR